MPQSSRKRNKGKDRKSKKAENGRARAHSLWVGWALGKVDFVGKNISCDHGFVIPKQIDHSIVTFMDDLTAHFVTSPALVNVFKISLESHPQVWNDDKYRKMALDIMKSIGTYMLLGLKSHSINSPAIMLNNDVTTSPNLSGALSWTNIIVAFENYDSGSNDIYTALYCKEVQTKQRDLEINLENIRDVFKFYRKRTSCKCLKKMHLEVRKFVLKSGACWYCDNEVECYLLMVCSRCMVRQYCSRKCQVADWPDHKEDQCDKIVNARK